MAKGKKRPVLYEVFNRSRRARTHGSFGHGPPATPTPEPKPVVKPPPAPPMLRPRPSSSPEPGVGEPVLRIVDGRVHLVLSWTYVGVIAVLLVAVAWALFYAGQRSATPLLNGGPSGDEAFDQSQIEPEAPSEIDLTPGRRQSETQIFTPVSPGNESPRATPPSARQTPPARTEPAQPAFEFQPGQYYVRVQYFRSTRMDHAQAAARFLGDNGVPCVIREAPQDIQLFATQPFASEREAASLCTRIKELGKEYAKDGGGYDFDGCAAAKPNP